MEVLEIVDASLDPVGLDPGPAVAGDGAAENAVLVEGTASCETGGSHIGRRCEVEGEARMLDLELRDDLLCERMSQRA